MLKFLSNTSYLSLILCVFSTSSHSRVVSCLNLVGLKLLLANLFTWYQSARVADPSPELNHQDQEDMPLQTG